MRSIWSPACCVITAIWRGWRSASYWDPPRAGEMNDVRAEPLTVDANGLCPPETVDDAPRLIFATPSHQYPLGAVMSLERRQRLLHSPVSRGAGSSKMIMTASFAFRSADPPCRVWSPTPRWSISAPSARRSIPPAPGLRGDPRPLVSDLKHAHAELYRGGHSLIQMALAEFITAGHIRPISAVCGCYTAVAAPF